MTQRQQKVHTAALSMIKRYNRTALQQVEQRIQELEEYGEDETVVLWREIRSAVKRLLNDSRNGS